MNADTIKKEIPEKLTVREVLDLFGATRSSLYRWIEAGKIKALRTPSGRITYILGQSVAEYLPR